MANAEQKAIAANERFDVDELVVSKAIVNGGQPLKRIHAAAQGRATPLITLRPAADERATMRCAAALRGSGLSVAIGEVAESAGLTIVNAEVVDERRVKLDDGRVVDAESLAREHAR